MPDEYAVEVLPPALKDLRRIDPPIRLTLLNDLVVLRRSPFPAGTTTIKRLTGTRPPLFRLRSGDYRTVYRVVGNRVEVLAVVHRKDLDVRLRSRRVR